MAGAAAVGDTAASDLSLPQASGGRRFCEPRARRGRGLRRPPPGLLGSTAHHAGVAWPMSPGVGRATGPPFFSLSSHSCEIIPDACIFGTAAKPCTSDGFTTALLSDLPLE